VLGAAPIEISPLIEAVVLSLEVRL